MPQLLNPEPRPQVTKKSHKPDERPRQRNEDRQCQLDVPQLLGPEVPSQIRLRRLRKDHQVASGRRLGDQLHKV